MKDRGSIDVTGKREIRCEQAVVDFNEKRYLSLKEKALDHTV